MTLFKKSTLLFLLVVLQVGQDPSRWSQNGQGEHADSNGSFLHTRQRIQLECSQSAFVKDCVCLVGPILRLVFLLGFFGRTVQIYSFVSHAEFIWAVLLKLSETLSLFSSNSDIYYNSAVQHTIQSVSCAIVFLLWAASLGNYFSIFFNSFECTVSKHQSCFDAKIFTLAGI